MAIGYSKQLYVCDQYSLKASYEILTWWFLIKTPGSGCNGLYQI